MLDLLKLWSLSAKALVVPYRSIDVSVTGLTKEVLMVIPNMELKAFETI